MMAMSDATTIVKGNLIGGDARFSGVKTDSRKVAAGDLFVAIPGEKFDGHDFVGDAGQAGAAGAVVSAPVETPLPRIEVDDTTRALGLLAAHWRSGFSLPVAAITGSNGKTTVTAMVAAILGQSGNCLAPEGSFNNQWGVPLTLLKLSGVHDYAVIEMGMNSPGEIEYLSGLTQPTVALINNAAPAHLEGMGDLRSIAREKSEIFTGLAADGIAVINADDEFCSHWIEIACADNPDRQVVTFGMQNPADIWIDNLDQVELANEFDLKTGDSTTRITLPLAGAHNVMNALAAAAVCTALGVAPAAISSGLSRMQAVPGRLVQKQGINGAVVLDDSYNANPHSIAAGVDVLGSFGGTRILVLGAMAELGQSSDELHREVGAYARQKGINLMYCLATGDGSRVVCYAEGFGPDATVFDNIDELVDSLKSILGKNHVVLVKGSRSSRMERVVEKISFAPDPVAENRGASC
jgi:UDP-N-acetylmuramoyl-tripeptide--D-alanyl-D-alanine ligase